MEIVIGLIGAKGAGKTTAFNAIKDIADVQEITLASKLKDVSAQVFDIPRTHFDSHDYKEAEFDTPIFLKSEDLLKAFKAYQVDTAPRAFFDKFVRPHIGKILLSPRQVAQYLGTEVLRDYEADIHCLSAADSVTKSIGVVTDMRFPNEFDFFKERYSKFYSIYIQNMAAEIKASSDTHASEAYLKTLARQANFTITNNDGIDAFIREIKHTVQGVLSHE